MPLPPPLGDIEQPKDGSCENCRTHPARKQFYENLRELAKEITSQELTEILGSTIKKDDVTKINVFLDMVLTYTERDQQNAGLIAASSTGKSYIPLELAPYFPDRDVIKLGYASPTAFFHEWGLWIRDPRLPPLCDGYEESEDEEEKKKRQQKENLTVIDLHQKILIFLDSPHSELLKNLRSLLSHDDKYIEQRITDRSQKSGMRTRKILLIGYPTVLFCSANTVLDEQEKTRLNLYSPESSQEKLREAIAYKIHKDGDRNLFEKQIADDPKRTLLQIRIADIKRMDFRNITISEELQAEINQKFIEMHQTLQARHQRDIGRLLAKIKAFAILNYHSRKHDTNGNLEVNREDVINGFAQYETYRESNEIGLPPEFYNAFLDMKEDFLNPGLTIDEYQKEYFKNFKILLGRDKARAYLKAYTTVGLLYEVPDATDKRKVRYMCGEVGTSITEEGEKGLEEGQKRLITPPTPNHLYLQKSAIEENPEDHPEPGSNHE